MAKKVSEPEYGEPVGPRGDLGAYLIATLGVLMALVAWLVAANANNKANTAIQKADKAYGTAADAKETAENSHTAAETQASDTGAGIGADSTAPAVGNTQPNGNGQ